MMINNNNNKVVS